MSKLNTVYRQHCANVCDVRVGCVSSRSRLNRDHSQHKALWVTWILNNTVQLWHALCTRHQNNRVNLHIVIGCSKAIKLITEKTEIDTILTESYTVGHVIVNRGPLIVTGSEGPSVGLSETSRAEFVPARNLLFGTVQHLSPVIAFWSAGEHERTENYATHWLICTNTNTQIPTVRLILQCTL